MENDAAPKKDFEIKTFQDLRLFQVAALFVFVGASAVILVHTFLGSMNNDPMYISKLEEIIEITTRIIALSLILLFVLIVRHWFSVVFSLLIVCTLIIPTRDVIRLYLLATGSQRDINEFYALDGNILSSSMFRSDHITNQIRSIIKGVFEGNFSAFDQNDIEMIANEVRKEILLYEIIVLAERLLERSMQGLLIHLHEYSESGGRGIGEWLIDYEQHHRFSGDIASLHSMGLIKMDYDDWDTIEPTEVGHSMARLLSDVRFLPGSPSAEIVALEHFNFLSEIDPIISLNPIGSASVPGQWPEILNPGSLSELDIGDFTRHAHSGRDTCNLFKLNLDQGLYAVMVRGSFDTQLAIYESSMSNPDYVNDDYGFARYALPANVTEQAVFETAWQNSLSGLDSMIILRSESISSPAEPRVVCVRPLVRPSRGGVFEIRVERLDAEG